MKQSTRGIYFFTPFIESRASTCVQAHAYTFRHINTIMNYVLVVIYVCVFPFAVFLQRCTEDNLNTGCTA